MSQAMTANHSFTEYHEHLYVPRDYETGEMVLTTPDRQIWHRLTPKEFRVFANDVADILFASNQEFNSFLFMTKQFANRVPALNGLLVPVKDAGVFMLDDDGSLVPALDQFVPNSLNIMYDPTVDTTEMWDILVGWLNSEEQAHSLLHHLSLGFQPWWSASKYILLIGEGSNGKSMLLRMLMKIIGIHNASNVKRQEMSAQRPTIMSLNGSLMNIVFDGPKEFVRDNSTEKTLTAGEPLEIELKYENISSTVQTNALFIEGLNREPKNGDQSHAMHRRLVRYYFPNQYAEDQAFEAKLMHPKMLSALVKLILEHWVSRMDKAKKLTQTESSKQLQLEYQWSNNPLMQYLEHLATIDVLSLRAATQPNALVDELVVNLRSWMDNNGYRTADDAYLRQLIDDLFVTTRKTIRVNKKPTTRRVIEKAKAPAQMLLDTLTAGEDDDVV